MSVWVQVTSITNLWALSPPKQAAISLRGPLASGPAAGTFSPAGGGTDGPAARPHHRGRTRTCVTCRPAALVSQHSPGARDSEEPEQDARATPGPPPGCNLQGSGHVHTQPFASRAPAVGLVLVQVAPIHL